VSIFKKTSLSGLVEDAAVRLSATISDIVITLGKMRAISSKASKDVIPRLKVVHPNGPRNWPWKPTG
jgi:hypothetical protein